jgi:hypothetical protein
MTLPLRQRQRLFLSGLHRRLRTPAPQAGSDQQERAPAGKEKREIEAAEGQASAAVRFGLSRRRLGA